MSELSVSIQNISKRYRLGESAGTRSFSELLSGFGRRGRSSEKAVNEFWALRDISFDVREGEVVGIIGRNGAGKSTLLKVLSRITEPTSGRIITWGRVSSLLEVGTGFHPELTGRENVFLNGVILGMTRQEVRRRFDEIIAFAGIEKFIDTPVKRYSSGMRVRLAFAVAAHLESEILVVDEVLSVGDAEFQKKSLGKMEDIAAKGRTVLFVSHDMGTIRKLCGRGVLLDGGQLAYQGGIEETITRYLDLYSEDSAIHGAPTGSEVITAFRTARVDGCLTRTFGNDEHVTLELDVNFPADHLQFVFGLQLCVLPSMTKIFLDRYRVEPDARRATVMIKLPTGFLMPGEYVFNAGISSVSGEVLDRHDGIARFRVLDHASELSRVRATESGLVSIRCDWTLSTTVKPDGAAV